MGHLGFAVLTLYTISNMATLVKLFSRVPRIRTKREKPCSKNVSNAYWQVMDYYKKMHFQIGSFHILLHL